MQLGRHFFLIIIMANIRGISLTNRVPTSPPGTWGIKLFSYRIRILLPLNLVELYFQRVEYLVFERLRTGGAHTSYQYLVERPYIITASNGQQSNQFLQVKAIQEVQSAERDLPSL